MLKRRTLVAGATAAAAGAAGLVATTRMASAQTTLRGAADALGKDIGVAVNAELLNDAQYAEVVAEQFNNVTAENAMKWESLQPARGEFNFADGDALVEFAEDNAQSVHGHTLVWHSQTPQWVHDLAGDDLRAAMLEHTETVLEHYSGRVATWDVANEIFEDDGTLRDSFWLQGLGEGYVAEAFAAAREFDPDARLYLNDYSIDGINPKSTAYYELAQELVADGLLDGMGFQAHLILGQVPSDMADNLERFAELGLEVRVTELDVRIETPSDETEFQQQAEDFGRVGQIVAASGAASGMTVWGLRDGDSWVPDTFPGYGDPLLYNDDYSTKPAYDAVLTALGG